MKKMLLVMLMLLVAGTVADASVSQKTVKCDVKGKTKMVKTVDACKALGGTVVEAKKVA